MKKQSWMDSWEYELEEIEVPEPDELTLDFDAVPTFESLETECGE